MVASQPEKEHRFWNAMGLLIFVGLCSLSFALIFSYGDFVVDHVGFLDLALLGLAAFRLIHLITYDRILDFTRVVVMDSEGGRLKAADRGWRRAVCELMACLWCAGLWSALVVVTVCALGSWGRMATLVFGSGWSRIAVASNFQNGRCRAMICAGLVSPYFFVS